MLWFAKVIIKSSRLAVRIFDKNGRLSFSVRSKNLVTNPNFVNIFMSFVCLAPSDVFGLNNIKYKLQVKD